MTSNRDNPRVEASEPLAELFFQLVQVKAETEAPRGQRYVMDPLHAQILRDALPPAAQHAARRQALVGLHVLAFFLDQQGERRTADQVRAIGLRAGPDFAEIERHYARAREEHRAKHAEDSRRRFTCFVRGAPGPSPVAGPSLRGSELSATQSYPLTALQARQISQRS